MGNFNSEMDNYLSKRKKDTVLKTPSKNVAQKFLNFIYGETKVEETNEEEFEKEYDKNEVEEKQGVFAKLKKWFSSDEEPENDNVVEEQKAASVVNEDIKEVLKLQNRWLSKLPAKTIREFKESEDYKKIKELLDKHSLIKKN